MAAFSMIEIVFVLGVAATLTGVAVPNVLGSLDEARASGAARFVSARLQQARLEAVSRNVATAIRFEPTATGWVFTAYVDGNRNGVLARDIRSGVDYAVSPAAALTEQFPGVDFGTSPGLPPPDADTVAPGVDPIRLGASGMAVFTPDGTATPGTLYIVGRQRRQFAVRIFGETGRVRVLEFNAQSAQWMPLAGS